MEVIITHVNADFDAFASMVAAKKLYPDAVVAFPGSQEKNLRDYFILSTMYILSIERAKDIDLDAITRLIIVDTRQKNRIGRFSEIVDSKDLNIHIYDHHPDTDDDVRGDFEIVREVGATTTILVEEMRRRDLTVNAEEATVLALGLYEDTGSFNFSSTTPADLEVAAWLLSKGANLNIIGNMMTSEWSRDQIEVLHQLIQESESVSIGGLDIIVTTAGAEGYVGDLAVLVHKYKDMDNLDAIFALVRMEDRVHLIARSSVEEVNAGEIAAEFGGGGHSTAASATIRDLSLFQARDTVIRLLRDRVKPKRLAGEIMTKPVITTHPDQTLQEAAETLSRYEISSLPVVRDGALLGILHRSAVERAAHHGLCNEPVHEYMNPGVVFVTPQDYIEKVMRITVENRLRLVPVIEAGELAGVISRSDLLEHLKLPKMSDSTGPEEFHVSRPKGKSLRKLMDERLPSRVIAILRKAGVVAAARHEDAYLVGGAVRDLILRKYNLDIDVVVEGNGILFAKALAREYPGCKVRHHVKFGTATLQFADGFKMDVAGARHEYYSRPGALPEVEMSSIKRDLYRRDFTMNTLAVSLTAQNFGQVIDFFGGSRDIKEKTIRVLHNLAFVEDPTRILRAVRFSSRFNFAISKHTMNLVKTAMRMSIFDKIRGKRILNELKHILESSKPLPALSLLAELNIPQAVCPCWSVAPKTFELIESVTGVLAWWKYQALTDRMDPWMVYFHALMDALTESETGAVMERLAFPQGRIRQLVTEKQELGNTLAFMARGQWSLPSDVTKALGKLSLEAILFMMAKTTRDQSRASITQYINEYRHVRPILTGKDLIQMGYKPGPQFGAVLSRIREERLDGRIFNVQQECEMACKLLPTDERKDYAVPDEYIIS